MIIIDRCVCLLSIIIIKVGARRWGLVIFWGPTFLVVIFWGTPKMAHLAVAKGFSRCKIGGTPVFSVFLFFEIDLPLPPCADGGSPVAFLKARTTSDQKRCWGASSDAEENFGEVRVRTPLFNATFSYAIKQFRPPCWIEFLKHFQLL